jgi:hypothetical protein
VCGVFIDNAVSMDPDLKQIDERLTVLEREFAVQAEVAAAERSNYATKADVARIEAAIASLQGNQASFATKQDIARLEAAIAVLQANQANFATKQDVARVEAAIAVLQANQANFATKQDIARIDATLTAIQSNYATKADLEKLGARLAQLETRLTRWTFATLFAIGGMNTAMVLIVVKLMH